MKQSSSSTEKQTDSHKVCTNCPPLAGTQACKHVGH